MSATWWKNMKSLVPRSWRRRVGRLVRGPVYAGDYASWAEAAAVAQGYGTATILEKTVAAARAVREGRAAWDRDTVLFPEPARHEPLLAALRQAAAAHGGRLHLVDLGGALGSTWWQHRTWLADLKEVRWSVVDQPAFAAAGRGEFTAGPLHFYDSLADCCAAEKPEVILLSSVLPYLEAPHAMLADVRRRGFSHVIIDRTGFVTRGRDRLTVQHVPPSIYPGSYPCWFFDRAALLAPFAPGWRIAAEWPGFDQADIDAAYGGLMLEKTGA